MKQLTKSTLIIHTRPTGHLGNGNEVKTNQNRNIMKKLNDNDEFLPIPGQPFVQINDESDLPLVNNVEETTEEPMLPNSGYDFIKRKFADDEPQGEQPMGITGVELK
jgi:hypothetical protein